MYVCMYVQCFLKDFFQLWWQAFPQGEGDSLKNLIKIKTKFARYLFANI